jgi:hypothetical protein
MPLFAARPLLPYGKRFSQVIFKNFSIDLINLHEVLNYSFQIQLPLKRQNLREAKMGH